MQHAGHVVGGVHDHPRVHRRHPLRHELEGGEHAEVAAPAPDRPEEVGVLGLGEAQSTAVGGDDVGGDEAVDGQAVVAHHPADPASGGEPADADGLGVTGGEREPAGAQRARHVAPPGAGAHADPVAVEHLDAGERRHVDDQAAVVGAPGLDAVPATADRQRSPAETAVVDGRRDLFGRLGPDDQRG